MEFSDVPFARVAIDGNTAVINGFTFERDPDSGAWSEGVFLPDANGIEWDIDGDVIVGGNRTADLAQVWERQEDGSWAKVADLRSIEAPPITTEFGTDVAVSGNRIVVSAVHFETPGSTVEVFDRIDGTWQRVKVFRANTRPPTVLGNAHFAAVAVEGDLIAFGTSLSSSGTPEQGTFWARQDRNGDWQLDKLAPTGLAEPGQLGVGVAIDHGRIYSSTQFENKILVFDPDGQSFVHTATLSPSEPQQERFTAGDTLDVDNGIIVAGARDHDSDTATDVGRVLVFDAPPLPVGCEGRIATVLGTKGPDTLTGTDGPDVIAGLGGDDTITGLGGDDIICAGAGNDTVNAGDGNDYVLGQAGDDTVDGGTGIDVLIGAVGNDRLTGGRDTDLLLGQNDRDVLSGGTGDDLIIGGGNNDRLLGGTGRDGLAGDAGSDTLTGGPDPDHLDGGPATDTCTSDPQDTFSRCE
jgi:hypothetical protein